ncbi:MAG: monofunctional biosynthetic peptidoglycan transglycosylase [Bacteriovoracaceae bacterium]|jgi:monofunctional glycosyltransferase|nr:monofunctional biosynthetic peptidoglycan transglycosylase [Bacteriovoracaceae bacterium]
MRLKKRYFSATIFLALLAFILFFYYLLIPRNDIKKLATGYVQSKIDAQRKANYKIVYKKPYKWIKLRNINKKSYQAIMISEDSIFYKHQGVDFDQVKAAVKEKLKGKRLRGASTITQQLIKNLFLTPDKNIWRKLKEMGFSVYLEKNVSKDKILELYLNIIEYGPGIYGIDAAAEHYFKKSPADLTAKEGAFLAMLLPNPKRYGESFNKGKLTPYAEKTMRNIINKMKIAKFLDKEEAIIEMDEPFNWEEGSTDEYESLGEGELFDGSAYKNIHQKLKLQLIKHTKENTIDKKFKNGGKFEKRFRDDVDIVIQDDVDYDPDVLIEDNSGLEEEFKID